MDRRDLVILFAGALAAVTLLEARLFWLQVVQPDEYRADVRSRRHIELRVPFRGRIYDARGRLLADNVRSFDLDVVLEDFERDPQTAARVAALVARTPESVAERVQWIYRRIEALQRQRPADEHAAILRRERRTPYLLALDIPFDAAFEIETHPDRYPGAVVREGVRRKYLMDEVAGAILGYVGKVPEEEHQRWLDSEESFPELREAIGRDGLELLWRRGSFQDFIVGRAGIERTLDDRLRGTPGVVLTTRKPGGPTVETTLVEPAPGEDVRLTIDADLQRAAERALAGRRGAVVMMDVADGGLLALASSPGFNPNHFVPPAGEEELRAYFAPDSGSPLMNRAVSGVYPPGSVFKIVTALAGLSSGRMSPTEPVDCEGRFSTRYPFLRCWIYARGGGVHGPLTMPEALERSCNVFFYTTAVRAGAAEMSAWAYRCGYGRPSGLPLPQDRGGTIPRNARLGEASLASYGIGQGALAVTPIQVLEMVAGVARNGRGVRPRITADAPVVEEDWGVAPEVLAPIREGMRRVVFGDSGTARDIGLRAVRMAGKTGSAQVGGDQPAHAWFAGYFPHDAPRYAIVVLVEHGESGGHTAAPIAAAIAREALTR